MVFPRRKSRELELSRIHPPNGGGSFDLRVAGVLVRRTPDGEFRSSPVAIRVSRSEPANVGGWELRYVTPVGEGARLTTFLVFTAPVRTADRDVVSRPLTS